METDWSSISFGSSHDGTSYWCYPPLGFNNFYLTEHRCSLFVFLLLFWLWQHFLLDGLKVKNRIHYHPLLFCYPHIVIVFLQKIMMLLMTFLFDLFCSDKSFVGASVGYFCFCFFLLEEHDCELHWSNFIQTWIFMFVFNFVLFLVVYLIYICI